MQTAQDSLSTTLDVASTVLTVFKEFQDATQKAEQAFDATEVILELLSFISPLQTPINLIEPIIDKAGDATENLNDKLDTLSTKDDSPGSNENDFLDKLETGIDRAETALDATQDALTIKHFQLSNAIAATTNMHTALAAAQSIDFGEGQTNPWANLNARVEGQMGALNPDYESVNALFTSVREDMDALTGILSQIDFGTIYDDILGMGQINAVLGVLSGPLDLARGAVQPILPLLKAVDALVGFLVQPVIDFVLDKLGVKTLIETVFAPLDDLLPEIGLLDDLVALANDLKDKVDGFVQDQFQQVAWISQIDSVLLAAGDLIGTDDATAWGSSLPGVLSGTNSNAAAADNIFDGLGGADIITAGAGNDILIAGQGSDILNGGAGADLFYFDASFAEFGMARGDQDDPDKRDDFIFTHLLPVSPDESLGSDIITSLEDEDHVVFTDISFTGAELRNAIIGEGPIVGDVNPDNLNDLIFLSPDGDNELNRADGLEGNDRIFGSVEADELFGGNGNDVLVPGGADDLADGGDGFDTYQVLEGFRRTFEIDLQAGTAITLQGASSPEPGDDTLVSIENLVISPNFGHAISATNGRNSIITGGGSDVIAGLDGDDLIESNAGSLDVVIGGNGSDVVRGGAGDDLMVSGSAAVAGVVDIYDGGNGTENPEDDFWIDAVSYSQLGVSLIDDIFDLAYGRTPFGDTLDAHLATYTDSQSVVIHGDTGLIDRLNNDGDTVITTDITQGVEAFVGSDQSDTLYGGALAQVLHGAGGSDEIHLGSTARAYGGTGGDWFRVTDKESLQAEVFIDGGEGLDQIDLTGIEDVRWRLVEGDSESRLLGYEAAENTDQFSISDEPIFEITIRNIEDVLFSNEADLVTIGDSASSLAFYQAMGGDDYISALFVGAFGTVFAGEGNDDGFFANSFGRFFGGAGDDIVQYLLSASDPITHNEIDMGTGDDFVRVQYFQGDVDGGEGYDFLEFRNKVPVGVSVNTANGTAVSSEFNVTFSGIERFLGTDEDDVMVGSTANDNRDEFIGREGDDRLFGGAGNDLLYGGIGEDELFGGAGDDFLHGGTGFDRLDGGAGIDTVSYAWSAPDSFNGGFLRADDFVGKLIALDEGVAQEILRSGPEFSAEQLTNIENVIGTDAFDVIRGDDGDNFLNGAGGDDDIRGLGGNDILATGSGDDDVFGGDGDDLVIAGLGAKTLDGGSGTDTLSFGTEKGTVTVDFSTNSYTALFEDRRPVWLDLDLDNDGVDEADATAARNYGVESLTPEQMWRGINAELSLSAADAARFTESEIFESDFEGVRITEETVLVESSGTFTNFERVTGGEAEIRILLSDGVDVFDGTGTTRDLIDMSTATNAITFNIETGANNIANMAGDDLTGIDGIIAGSGQDMLTGDANDNILRGGDGHDLLEGGAGNDILIGGSEPNERQFDLARTDAVSFNPGATADQAAVLDGFDMPSDAVTVEFLYRANGGVVPESYATFFSYAAGTPTDHEEFLIFGYTTIFGQVLGVRANGNNFLSDVPTEVVLDGSLHRLSATYDGATGQVGLFLNGEKIAGGTSNEGGLAQDGRVVISQDQDPGGEFEDRKTMHGEVADIRVWNEVRSEEDIFGTALVDALDPNTHPSLVANWVPGADNLTEIIDVIGGDSLTLVGGPALTTIDNGDDTLDGGAGDDSLYGGAGNDMLLGGAGDDLIDGGAGWDTVSYADANARVSLFLNQSEQDLGGEIGTDTLISIENAIGTRFNDRINGDNADNDLYGGSGDDLLIGLGGNDRLYGEDDNDTLIGSGGDDYLSGGAGNDWLNGVGGRDTLIGDSGDDMLIGGVGVDLIDGGTGRDDAFGNFGQDVISGGAGDDNLRAGGAADTVNGDAGNDRLVGGNGRDVLWGGAGNDVLFGGGGNGNGDGLRDVFVFKSAANGGGGFDIIRDFEDTKDKIDLSESAYTSFDDVFADAMQVGAHVEIDFDGSGLLRIENFLLSELTAGDLIF